MTTTMEQNILQNWSEYERMCKAECERFARYNGHKRNAWVHEKNPYYDPEYQVTAPRHPTRKEVQERCARIVDLHSQGMPWAEIAEIMETPIRNIGKVLRNRGYAPND